MFVKRPKNVYNIFKIKQILNTRRISMKKGTKKFLFLSVATLAGMYAYNQFVASTSTKKNMLPTKNGSYYSWKQGNVFYTKLEQEILFFLFMTQIPLVHLLSGQKFQKDFKRNIRYIPWIFWAAVSPTNQG